MANRRGSPITVRNPNFAFEGALPGARAPIERPGGEADRVAAETFAALGRRAGAFADRMAVQEGERAGKIAGDTDNFTPTRGWTLRAQAFDRAALATFADRLEVKMAAGMQEIYQANKDSPAALVKAYDDFTESFVRDELGGAPELAGEIRARIGRLRLPFQVRAIDQQEERVREQARAALIENLASSQRLAAELAAGDPADPATQAAIEEQVRASEEKLDAAVAGNILDAGTAAQNKIKLRNDVTARTILGRAAKLGSAADIESFRAETRKGFSEGKIPDLTADGFDTLDAELQQLANARRTEGNQTRTLIGKRLDDMVKRAADGFALPPDEWTLLQAEALKVEGGAELLESAKAKLAITNVLKGRSLADGEELAARMRAELGAGASEAAAEVVRFAEKYVQDQRTMLGRDMLGLAQRKGTIPAVSALDLPAFSEAADGAAAAEALATQFQARTAQARAVAQTYRTSPQFLRPDEKAYLGEVARAGGERALRMVQAIIAGAGEDAPAVLEEIGGTAPKLAQAGVILAMGGSTEAVRDALATVQTEDQVRGAQLPSLEPRVRTERTRAVFGTAFARQPQDEQRIVAAADAITRTRLNREKIDPASSTAQDIYERALQEAAGARFVNGFQYGGVVPYSRSIWSWNYRTLVPNAIRADRFPDVIGALRDEDLARLPVPPRTADGTPYRARDIRGAVPVAVRGGYRFALGDPASEDPRWIQGADGRPFVLDIEAMEAELRRRVPDAYLGG